ncbi:MAG: DUF5718 family protein [Treponema sp.]|nr:DUF5718 family protein [Treponema sp.]
MNFDLEKMPCFGVAGNFTGHLEQAGEARDFANVATKEENAPKALFPTFIPDANEKVPAFLKTFPFSSDKIIFPQGEEKIQIEPECGVIFETLFQDGKITGLKPLCFGASNDCSIRKEGAPKISLKKNWGKSSKGFSSSLIDCDSFDEKGIINDYRIASFLIRDGIVYDYGEDSAVKDYSYIYGKLIDWVVEKLNSQKDEGPCENLASYLESTDRYHNIFVSIGATRYTDFGKTNFLKTGDITVVAVYNSKYTHKQISDFAVKGDAPQDVSLLCQKIVVGLE